MIETRVVLALQGLLNLLLLMRQVLGDEFMAFFYEALEKPWMVRKH